MIEKLSPQRVDPLEYWRNNNKLNPNVSKLVRVYLCPPPLASERAFEVAKNVVGDNRVRLRPKNLEMNLFLKYKSSIRAVSYDVKLNNLE